MLCFAPVPVRGGTQPEKRIFEGEPNFDTTPGSVSCIQMPHQQMSVRLIF